MIARAGAGRSRATTLPRLLLVTDRHRTAGRSLVEVIAAAVGAGLRFIQLRERDLGAGEYGRLHLDLLRILPDDAILVMNGRTEAARAAWGLHLPAAAPPLPPDVRLSIPVLGRSVHDVEEVRRALRDAPDYLVLGTIYETGSKPGRRAAGTGLVRAVRRLIEARDDAAPGMREGRPGDPFPRPLLYAIGGITVDRVRDLFLAGADGIAVCGTILESPNPGEATRQLVEALRDLGERQLRGREPGPDQVPGST